MRYYGNLGHLVTVVNTVTMETRYHDNRVGLKHVVIDTGHHDNVLQTEEQELYVTSLPWKHRLCYHGNVTQEHLDVGSCAATVWTEEQEFVVTLAT